MAALGSMITGQPMGSPSAQQTQSQFDPNNPGAAGQAGLDQFGNQTNQISGVQGNQTALANLLMQQATGGGPNVANAQLQQGLGQVQQQQAGAIGGIKGINPALQARMIQQGGQGASMQAAQQASVNRQQQQVNAQASLGQALAQQQAGNLGAQGAGTSQYGTAAGLGQATAAQNASNMLGVRGQNAQLQGGQLSSAMQGVQGAGTGLAALALMARGGLVPGQAAHPGNDPRNDTVTGEMPDGHKIKVSPGEGIIPRESMADEAKAAAFAKELVRRKKARGRSGEVRA